MLARELAHVVQQRTGRVRNPFGAGLALVQDRALEMEADRMALRAAAQPPSPVQRAVTPPRVVQRCMACGNSACQGGAICNRDRLDAGIRGAHGFYPDAVRYVNSFFREKVGIDTARADAIAENVRRVARGQMSVGEAHLREVAGFGRDIVNPHNGLSTFDRVVSAGGVVANFGGFLLSGVFEKQKMFGTGPYVRKDE